MAEPFHQDERVTLYHGDCLQVLADLPADSVDAVVTDPPYGLAFMGKRWDYDVPSVEIWQQVLRVLKPGGHLLAFAGTRTQHRMAVRIEDAGFEIRDLIMWVYGSGFPKSLDVSKAIDKAAGAEREVVGLDHEWIRRVGQNHGESGTYTDKCHGSVGPNGGKITAPATEAAKQWQGWGTALKPSCEPITMARKPLANTVAENVLQYGTGAINVDGCRVGTTKNVPASLSKHEIKYCYMGGWKGGETPGVGGHDPNLGRWPANIIHDGSEEVVGLFPETVSGNLNAGHKQGRGMMGHIGGETILRDYGSDSGSAARFFYTAKADSSERRGSRHPTVKPLDLMRYLVRLVCPVGAVVLDPFSGSGTTIEAARDEHCRSIGIELNEEYLADTLERLKQGVLF